MTTFHEPTAATLPFDARWTQLRSRVAGSVVTPQDPEYDDARRAWNLSFEHRPAVIVVAQSAADVAEALRFARSEGLGVAVQSTGHGVVRPADDALLLITSRMQTVRVDEATQTAWIEAGVKWGTVLEKTRAVGLAPLLGSSPDVGVMGYTLGGGMGWLGRKYGLAADSVRYFEVVTADGHVLHASETENSDLFWGLRGGGGSLGVVTGMEIQLYPVTMVYGGSLMYPVTLAREVFARYRDWVQTAPDELTSSVAIMNFPPLPVMPEFLRGQTFVIVRGCYCGPVEQGEALLQSWRAWHTPFIDDFKAMPFSQVATISNDPLDPMPGLSTGAWLREVSDEVIDVLVQRVVGGPVAFAEIRHAGGAIARVPADASAYSNREAHFLLQMVGMTPTPEALSAVRHFTDDLKETIRPSLTGGVYMNFLEGEESRQRIKDGYTPEKYARLAALKAKYDPENRLSYSFNIAPAQ